MTTALPAPWAMTASVAVPPAVRRVALATVGFAVWVAVWECCTTAGPLADTMGLPSAFETAVVTLQLATRDVFWAAVAQSLLATLLAVVIAAVLGLALGILMGMYRWVNLLLDPITQFLRSVPPVVVLPLILLLVGPSLQLAVILGVIGGVWPILVQSHVGVRDVDPVALDTARSMRLSWNLTQRSVVLPSALPYFASGVRIAASMTLMLTVGAGILGGAPGLGRLISTAQQAGDPASVFAMVIWAGAIGLALSVVLTWAEQLLMRTRQPEAIA